MSYQVIQDHPKVMIEVMNHWMDFLVVLVLQVVVLQMVVLQMVVLEEQDLL